MNQRPQINLFAPSFISIILIILAIYMVLVSPKPLPVFEVTTKDNSNSLGDDQFIPNR